MTKLGTIMPLFIVANLKDSVSFYTEKLGFKIDFIGPDDDPYFAIVCRDSVGIMLKEITPEIQPVPNHTRHGWARWDAYIYVDDPDSLYSEFLSKEVRFHSLLEINSDNLRGFEIYDQNGYIIYFGKPLPKQ
jgi:catechol 2,3-dioxygenase-like lactoylglutathione lyase family enzyme